MVPRKNQKGEKSKVSKSPEACFEEDPQKKSENENSTFPLDENSLEIIKTFKKKGKKDD